MSLRRSAVQGDDPPSATQTAATASEATRALISSSLTKRVQKSYNGFLPARHLGGVSFVYEDMLEAWDSSTPGGAYRHAWSARDGDAVGASARAGSFVEHGNVAARADRALGAPGVSRD